MIHIRMFLVATLVVITLDAQTSVPLVIKPANKVFVLYGGGGISMVDVMTVHASTGDETSKIQSFEVFDLEGRRVFYQSGCNGHDCFYDLGDLDSGTYYAVAHLGEEETIENFIFKK